MEILIKNILHWKIRITRVRINTFFSRHIGMCIETASGHCLIKKKKNTRWKNLLLSRWTSISFHTRYFLFTPIFDSELLSLLNIGVSPFLLSMPRITYRFFPKRSKNIVHVEPFLILLQFLNFYQSCFL